MLTLLSTFPASRIDARDSQLLHRLGNASLARLIERLRGTDPKSADALTTNFHVLTQSHSSETITRWILTGMRLYPNEPFKRLKYFTLADKFALQTLKDESRATSLTESIPSLTLLLEALAERSIVVQAQACDALDHAPLRPVLTDQYLLLPSDYTLLDTPDSALLFRASVAHATAHLRFSPAAQLTGTLKPMSVAVISAVEDARVEQLLMRDLPGVRSWLLPHLERSIQPDGLSFSALISRMSFALVEPAYQDDNYWVNKARSLFGHAATSLHDYAAFREIASVLANDLGQMRVRFHPQQYAVPAPYRDDNSFLWTYPPTDTPESIQEVGTSSKTDLTSTSGEPELAEELRRLLYPEWDYRLEIHRANWCTVLEHSPLIANAHATNRRSSRLQPLRLSTLATLSRSRPLRRQIEGEELDLDAAIEHSIDRRRGHVSEQRVFIRPASKRRSVSMLLLLDLSASTGDKATDVAQSVLDIEKDAALMLARAATAAGHRIAVHGFSSDTRARVDYYRLLDFGVALDTVSETPIAACVARNSTRMGAAIRHATALLSAQTGEHRALVVLSDGVPSDVDIYDSDYLVADAQDAASDARRTGLVTAGIAIETGNADYMRRIVGKTHCCTVREPTTLRTHLATLFARIAEG